MAGHRPSDWHVLDLDKDPTPGDPQRVRTLAKTLHDFADDVSEALRLVKGMAGEGALEGWAGKSATVFKEEFSGVPKNLKKLEKSYGMCGDALADFWPKLERAQALADKALRKAREAREDLTSAQSRLSSAESWVTRASKEADKYKDDPTGSKSDADKPDEAKVRAATRDVQHARTAQTNAQSAVNDAQSALDAAKKMAEDARKMREDAAREAKTKIDEASDAGIQNRSWWEEVGDWFTDNWDEIVAVCKVVVAVVGIVAMIIGGPILGAIVLVAALVVLADTLYKYSKGQASLWDVGLAALDCIPGMKGLTTLGGLAKGAKALGKTGLKGMALGVKGLGRSTRSLGRQMKKLLTRGDPVDMATGEMVMSATDVSLDGMLPLLFERHYRTGTQGGRLLGRSWTTTLDQRLVLDPSGVRYVAEDGMILTYPVPEPDVPVLPVEGPPWPMAWDGTPEGEVTVHRPEDGRTMVFRPLPQCPPAELPLMAIRDRNDNTIRVSYTADGTPEEIAHHGGYRIGVTCESGRITALSLDSDPERPVLIRYGYDTAGNLASVINSSGLPLRFYYDERRRMTRWEDRNGAWYRFAYDDAGRCTAGQGTNGFLDYTFTYDDEAHRTTAVDSLGHITVYQFNDAFQLVAETDPLGHVVRQEWNRRDQLVSRTDPLGRTTRMEWDAAGNLEAIHLPDGSTSTARFNELNLLVELTGYDGSVVRQEWDDRGNCTAVTQPDGSTVTFTHDRTGALTSLTDQLGAVQSFTNNAAGQPLSATDPLGSVWHYTYDTFGRSATVTDPLGSTTVTTWTIEGHQASRRDPDGNGEHWTYDGEGNCVTHTDALGQVTRFTYGPFDLLTSRTTPDGARYDFVHDTELRLVQVGGPRGATWDYVHDAAGRLVAETDFEGRTVTYVYDAAGQLLSRTNPLGQTTAFRYDSVGNQVEKTVDDSATTVFTHDAAGRLLGATGADATLGYVYDAAGRITSESIDGRATTTEYDGLGRRTRRTTPSGVTTRYEYDAAGNRTVLTASGRALVSSYDAAGRETTRRLGRSGLVLAQSWDTEDRLTGQTVSGAPPARPLKQQTYTYRADGCVTALDEQGAGRRTFDVDTMGRVTAVRAPDWTETYAYDEAGNQTWASWPEGQPVPEERGEREHSGHRVLRAGSVRYEYDAAGRVTIRRKIRLSRKPDVWRYTWDAEDRLISVVTPDGTLWRYRYDSLGRRVAKFRMDTDGTTVVEETRFTWDGPHLVEQTTRTHDGTEEHSLTWDREGVRPVAQTERVTLAHAPQEVVDERFFAVVTDLVGTPTELVSEEGDLVWRSKGTLWGLTAPDPDATAYTPLRFPGQYFDEETGLHHNYFRLYDPATGAYISPDPLGTEAGPNPYRYALNPLLWIDYLGLLTCRQNARRLRRNMRLEGRQVPRGHAAAHIVPSGGTAGHWVPGARSRALLERYGVDVNDAANGIPLGHPSPHNYTHREPFLRRVNQHLEQVVRDGVDQGMGVRAIRAQLRRELRGIGRQVEGELATGAPGPGAVWTA
ncbi:RHS repeat-associated core domain-containing protein [Streptomyces rochei]|uniref:RHS repeat-associated core domain-containing protein n=1 Tax=Streptomyces rochei TaxID=1928 RepID=UPI003676A33A